MPVKIRVPEPVLIREQLKPPVVALAPEIVRLFVVISMVHVVYAVSVKLRSVLSVAPVYCRVPPPNTKLAAAFVA